MSELKNIVLFVAQIDKPGGTERVVVNLANNFVAHGFNVKVFSVNTFQGEAYYSLNEAVQLQHLGVVLEKNVLKRVSWGYIQTIKKIKENLPLDASILMATDPITCYTFSILKKKFQQHKFIACEHMGIAIANKYSLLARKLLYGNLDAVVTLTNRDKQALIDRKIPCKVLEVIPNEISFFPTQSCNYNNKKLLAVGKLDNQKGFDLLLEYSIPVLKKYKDWKLDIVGQGPWLESLLQTIQSNKMSSQITIHPPSKNILEYYLNASIYVMTSRFEGFPMVLLEARACGLPVLSVDCPSGPADILHEDDGILVPMNAISQFQESLGLLVADDDLRQSLGQHARMDCIGNYSSETIFLKWIQLFNAI